MRKLIIDGFNTKLPPEYTLLQACEVAADGSGAVMASEPENLTLIYLRRIDEKVDRLIDDMNDVKARLTGVEENLARASPDGPAGSEGRSYREAARSQ